MVLNECNEPFGTKHSWDKQTNTHTINFLAQKVPDEMKWNKINKGKKVKGREEKKNT